MFGPRPRPVPLGYLRDLLLRRLDLKLFLPLGVCTRQDYLNVMNGRQSQIPDALRRLPCAVAQASLPAGYGSIPAPRMGLCEPPNLGRDAQVTRTLGSVRYNAAQFRAPRSLGCWLLNVGCSMFLFSALPAPALSASNPYLSTITNRNVFNLKPPVDPASLVPQAPAPALPPVKLAGITTLLGGKRAILRVARPARPPAPAGEESLMLAEGAPAESGISVLEINIAAATVRISNNGTIQTLDLEKDAPKSAPAPAVPTIPPPGGQPAIPVPQPAVAPGGGVTSVARPVRGAGPAGIVDPQAANNVATDSSAPGLGGGWHGGGMHGGGAQPAAMSAEEQAIMIEAQRISDPVQAPILPPTVLKEIIDSEQAANPTPF
jgi:hypothetical protein